MVLQRQPFTKLRLDEDKLNDKRKIFTISLNIEEYNQLIEDMKILHQAKEGTALKLLWKVGRDVLHDQKTGRIIRLIFDNQRKNERIGISDVSVEIPEPIANVTQIAKESNTFGPD